MKEVPQDKEREEYYLEEKLTFPFKAKCISR
jgi:hypothetical protein